MVRRYSTARRGGLNLLPIFFLLFLVVAGVLLVLLFPAYQSSRFGKFDRFNLIINQDPLVAISADIKARSAVVLLFPSEVSLQSAHGYGQLPAAAIYKAGEWDKRGRQVLGDTVSDTLGLPVDLVTDPVSPTISKDNYTSRLLFWQKDFLKFPKFSLANFLGSKANRSYEFNLYDWIRFALFWSGLRSDRVSFLNLSSSSVDFLQENGSQIRTLDLENFDMQLKDRMSYDSLLSEGYRVAIINSTPINGLAARASRLLTNVGINVVYTDSQSNGLTGCEVSYGSDAVKTSKTLTLIVEYFDCKAVQNKDLDSRFDLLVVLGNQFAQRFEK